MPIHNRNAMMIVMRYPEGHKEEVRQRIVEAAARALRRHGIEGISIPALMKQAGLTHGGFYTHFKSRDELVAAAVLCAASQTARSTFGNGLSLKSTLGHYLSKAHVDHPEKGCVLAALGTEGARQPARVRAAFAEVARGFLDLTEAKIHPDGEPGGEPSDAALAQAAAMVGAVMLARLVRDADLSARILATARVSTR